MKLTIIGDVHGNIHEYQKITENCEMSICVGDFGFKREWDWHRKNIDPSRHLINMGNHDYTPAMKWDMNCDNFWCNHIRNYMTIRGAWSIDKARRIEGRDWFANEELTYQEGLIAFDAYVQMKPKIVISHDCPDSIRQTFFGITEKSNTSNLLQAMFEAHQPELWIFGHHHKHRDSEIFGTRFICLEELETFEIEI